jgi:DNA-binding GntR family transcriptional regulator
VVETERYRGTRVRRISDREMREAFYVRGLLDEEAARLAAPRIQKDSSKLRRLLERLLKAAKAGQPEAYAQANHAFHRAIVEASGNEVLLKIWDSLAMESLSRLRLVQIGLRFRTTAPEHASMVEALERGDGARAGRLLRRHAHSFLSVSEGGDGGGKRPGDDQDNHPATRIHTQIESGKRAGESEHAAKETHGNPD